MGKKNRKKRKPRHSTIELGFANRVEISSINFDKGGNLVFTDKQGSVLEPKTVSVGRAYQRSSKPKVLLQIPAMPNAINLNIKKYLKNQTRTLVCDTNYLQVRGILLCVSASDLICYRKVNDKRMAEFFAQDSLVFLTNLGSFPEHYGWRDIVERFMNSDLFDSAGNYGLVVDSDLKSLTQINNRELPMYDNHYLQKGFELIYASADSGSEEYLNYAIRECDRRSSRTIKALLNDQLFINNLKTIKDPVYKNLFYCRENKT